MVELIKNRTANHVTQISIELFQRFAQSKIKTVTLDNGKEFSNHESLGEAIGVSVISLSPIIPGNED